MTIKEWTTEIVIPAIASVGILLALLYGFPYIVGIGKRINDSLKSLFDNEDGETF